MQHLEFLDSDHFENKYHRHWVRQGSLLPFIDFFWETDFDSLWPQHPDGFCDVLFPNVGYTYLINLGTPFVMQVGDRPVAIKSDGFAPRHKPLVCQHTPGNKIFGIKFKIAPLLFQKRIDFSEYRDYIFPLAYLIDPDVIAALKNRDSFQKRVELASAYYKKIIDRHQGALQFVDIVAGVLRQGAETTNVNKPVTEWAALYGISTRTLQRYFETATGFSCKEALQLVRMRKALTHWSQAPHTFQRTQYGYYDNSHFQKHLKTFLGPAYYKKFQQATTLSRR